MSSVPSWLNVRPSRGTAFTIHLVLSLLVFSTLVAVMLVYWFPGDLFIMDGGWEGLKLVAMVDLVLGPALTLILFKPGKPGLKMDLSVIAAIQVLALGYGFYTTYNQRTVAVVFAEQEFATVSANDIIEANYALENLSVQPGKLPAARAFSVPQFLTPAYEDGGKYFAELMAGYPGAHHRSDQYVALSTAQHEQMSEHAKSVDELETAGTKALISDELRKHDLSIDQVEVYEFSARYGDGYALYDPAQARVIDFVATKAIESQSATVAEADS